MPTRVSAQQNAVHGHAQSRASNQSRNDDSGSGAEGPARKRLQKSPSNAHRPERRMTSTLPSKPPVSGTNTRRRASSIRDQHGPQSKRSTSQNTVPPTSDPVNNEFNRTTTRSRGPSINSISRFSFASINQGREENEKPPDPNEFLTPMNFDDFHNNIVPNEEPSLNNFPLPGRRGAVFGSTSNEGRTFGNSHVSGGQNGVQPSNTARISRSGSLVRRPSNAARHPSQVPMASSTESMAPPPSQSNVKSRRQSHFPPSTSSNVGRAPRKSIGPGILTSNFPSDSTAHRRRPSLGGKKNSLDQQTDESTLAVRVNNRGVEHNKLDGSRFLSTTRSTKAKSLQPPSREPREHLGTPTRTPDHSRSSSTNAARTPNRSGPGANTPSSSKRVSVMPSHATGLGARTISPTDARRLKRLSTMQAPPMPFTPPTPQPEAPPSIRPRSSVQSPSMIPRKSVTPSSNRTTPDPNRKSYSSGLSLSSNTSYNSYRNSNGSMQPKLPQNLSTSRLPTPKPRADALGGNNDEEVPPVPAIPKAYESPRNEIDQPFFSARKSSLGYDANFANLLAAQATPTESDDPWNDVDVEPTKPREPIHREPESKQKSGSNIGKKNLQPLRLPPLNLLPLSTPTSSKIAALQDDDHERGGTPPRQIATKTPSTPMTASKATFFSKSHREDDPGLAAQMRSSSTHFTLRSDSSAFRAPSSSSTNILGLDSSNGVRNMSPFLSSSLPKTSGEYNYVRPKISGEYGRVANIGTGRLTGPRAQTASQSFKEDPGSDLSTPTDPPDTPHSGTSIRQKFGLTRKRSVVKDKGNEKSSGNVDHPKYDTNMPPPKLPASATWSNLAQHSTSPASKPNYIKSRRKTSSGSIGPTRSATELTHEERERIEAPEHETPIPRSTSMFGGVQKILAPKTPSKSRSSDSNLDRDDLIAEDEMKRLGSKRKDFEVAARELDELYRRATPKDAVSASQALRMACLNIFERGEIVDYKEVFFCGRQNAKKLVGDLKAESANFGYDDDRGDYQIVEGDHLAYRYEVVDVLGKGSFGQVVRCVDHKTGGLVAVKIIRNKKRFHQQALVEVNILQKLKEWDPEMKHSVVNFTQNFYFRGHLCISTELLGMNLYEFIKAHDFRGFSLKLIRRFTKQLLGSLVLLNGKKVIHCDLKPENVLLAHPMHSEIKVIDFGSSCFENEKVYTYIQSRFYRSPEVILGMSYGMPIDMWSLGCILAELYTGYPIFPGENEQEQLACIMEIFGPPEKHLIEKSSRKKLFFDSLGKPRLTVSSKGRRRRPSSKELRQALKCDDEAFVDFIAKCLRWDPVRRLTPQEAMLHEFITGVKVAPRLRPQLTSSNSSPVKRVNSITTPANSRPLPEPPTTSIKVAGSTVRNVTGNSPVKTVTTRRQSAANTLQNGAGVKRTSNGAAIAGSGLPRVNGRSASGKPDLATAAAATSLKIR